MADATNYLRNELIGWMVEGQEFDPSPDYLYVALHTDDPGDDATMNEVDSLGYSRYQTTIPGDWDVPQTGEFENAIDLEFQPAEENWGEITHFSLWDGPDVTDNALAQDNLADVVTVLNGDSAVFRASRLSGTFE